MTFDEEYAELMSEWEAMVPMIERGYDLDAQIAELRQRLDKLEGKPQVAQPPRVNVLLLHVKQQKKGAE